MHLALCLVALALWAGSARAQGAAVDDLAAAAAPRPAASAEPGPGEVAAPEPRRYRASDRLDRPSNPADAPAFYAVRDDVRLFYAADSTQPMNVALAFREGVRVLAQEGPWSLIQHGQRRAYVASSALSNVWIRVDKSERTVHVYRGAALWRTLPADVSSSDENKTQRGTLGERDTYRMPEGTYFVTRKNPRSEYHRAFVISYPNEADAERGLRDGLISREEYAAIVRADLFHREPPMGTPLGGLIEIHGHGSGRQRAWTRGCVAVRNVHMDWLWDVVEVGTPVVIEQ